MVMDFGCQNLCSFGYSAFGVCVCSDNLTAQSFVIKTCEWFLLGEITSMIRTILKNNGLEMFRRDKTIAKRFKFSRKDL